MMLKRLFTLGLVLAFAGITHAVDILKLQDVEVAAGESVTVNIELNNTTTNLMGWQCDISLPKGLTLELKANGKPKATLGERFSTTGHSISSSCMANGDYRFIATSFDGEAIPETSGTLFTVTLNADVSLVSSTKLTGSIKKIEFNTQDNKKLTFDDVTFAVNIVGTTIVRGDANNDGKITVTDIAVVVNHILQLSNTEFSFFGADANGDNQITVTDIGVIVDMILGNAANSRMLQFLEPQ